jgi:short-subunit dehydrogenase
MKKVLITGGSEGIGYAFAREYAKSGSSLTLVARDLFKLQNAKEELQQQYKVPVKIITCDLSQEGSAEALYAQVKEEGIDVVINNAGCGKEGGISSIPNGEDRKMIQLNISSLLVLTKLFAQQMKERREGIILNVASTGAFQPGPYFASYYASKSFVLSYTRAVHEEMKGTGVQIYCLCPGPVDTAFYIKSQGVMNRYHQSAEECVKYTLDHMKNSCMIIPGFWNRVLYFLPARIKMKVLAKTKRK